MSNTALEAIFERYEGREVYRLYLTSQAATAFAVTPAPNGRVFIDTDNPQIAHITVKAGWFVVQGSSNARQQYYVNADHVVAVVWNSDEDLP